MIWGESFLLCKLLWKLLLQIALLYKYITNIWKGKWDQWIIELFNFGKKKKKKYPVDKQQVRRVETSICDSINIRRVHKYIKYMLADLILDMLRW